MAQKSQKSITSFFTVQKKKVEETRENVIEKTSETPEKKCDEKSPTKGAAMEVDSPVATGGKRRSRKLVLSSEEEEENMSPKSSAGSSKSISPEDKKPVRKKQIRGASALKEIEKKRAAKKARLELVAETKVSEVKTEKPEEKSEQEEMETEAPSSPSKDENVSSPKKEDKSDSPAKETSPAKDKSPVKKASPKKEESPIKEKSPVKDKSPVKEKSPVKDKSPVKGADTTVTSDFSDEEDTKEKESPVAKPKGKAATKTAAKKKSPAVSKKAAANKKSPAVEKKAPAAEKKPISKFFTGGKKTDSSGEQLGIAKPTETSGYNPMKSKYHPIDDASWEKDKPVPYLALARTLECIEETSARLRITDILANFLRSVIVLSPDNLIPSLYLCLNKLAPAFEGLELGLAERSLMKAVAQSSGRSEKQVLEELEELGDLGIVAQNSCGKQRKLFHPPPLTVPKVFNQLRDLAAMKGKDVMSRKQDKIVAMYNACKPIEARYLIRSLNGKLRIGLAEQTVLQALALACTTTPPCQGEYPPPIMDASKGISSDTFQEKLKQQALILKTTYCECPVYEKVIPVLLAHGIDGLPEHCQISPGIPLRPMLAQPTKGVADVLARFDGRRFTCEWKYDGERAQVHYNAEQKSVRIFSRNQEDNTSKFPEIVSRLSSQLSDDVKECILDCEAVGWDRETNRILPFQILSTRKKKDANEADIKVQVCLFVFDLLYVNGEPLVKVPLEERRQKLKDVVKEVPGQLQFADSLDTDNVDEVQEYLEQSIKGNCEGLMVKTLQEEATYEIAKRSRNWLKLKKDYLEGVGDTLDLVVIGGYLGRGKRAGVYGGFLLACYDPETEQYQSICKIGTGFTDEFLQQHSDFLKPHMLAGGARSYYHCDPSLTPDHWFDAVQVWEVKCADLSLSPIHKAALGIVDSEKGISLRFPRFLRIRDDKKVEEATSAAQVAELYQSQEQVKNQTEGKTFNEEDFY